MSHYFYFTKKGKVKIAKVRNCYEIQRYVVYGLFELYSEFSNYNVVQQEWKTTNEEEEDNYCDV